MLPPGFPIKTLGMSCVGQAHTPQNNTSRLSSLIQSHYNTKSQPKSEQQIRRESYLIPGCVPFSRWFCMPAAVCIQFCSGSLYSWSVYNKPIDAHLETKNMAPITFYIAIGFFGVSASIMGPWLERKGPSTAAFLGVSLFFFGHLLTAVALHVREIWLVYLGYGVFCGFGIGLCYISPVSTLQKWFPDRRGLASGFAVSGFGAGSIVITKVVIPLVNLVGLPLTFVVLGSIFFIVMTLCALVLRTPPPDFTINGMNSAQEIVTCEEPTTPTSTSHLTPLEEDTLIESLTSKDFRFMYVMFLSNTLFGVVLISRLSNLVTDIFHKSADTAATIVAINGAFNLIGRLTFSISSDYIGRKSCYIIMLTTQLLILALFYVITTTATYTAFLPMMWILTACYGAGFGVIPAYLTDKFGPKNIGACHGVMMTAWSVSAVVGGLTFNIIFNRVSEGRSHSDPIPYIVNTVWIAVVVAIGWLSLMFIKPLPPKQVM